MCPSCKSMSSDIDLNYTQDTTISAVCDDRVLLYEELLGHRRQVPHKQTVWQIDLRISALNRNSRSRNSNETYFPLTVKPTWSTGLTMEEPVCASVLTGLPGGKSSFLSCQIHLLLYCQSDLSRIQISPRYWPAQSLSLISHCYQCESVFSPQALSAPCCPSSVCVF